MRRADEQSLQLVEVNPKATPPVCKIMDYGKFKYETAKRERETKKNKKSQELKEVKFRPKTHDHDFDFKVKHARRFLEDNNKVRLLVQFRGREIVHPETGRDVLNRVIKAVMDLATVIQTPSMEGNRMSMILAPKASLRDNKPRPSPTPASANKGRSTMSGDKPKSGGSATAKPSESKGTSKPEADEAPAAAPDPGPAVTDKAPAADKVPADKTPAPAS